jgi:predicted CoA-binding protein
MDDILNRLFLPATIALVGVSSDERSLSRRYLSHLIRHGYDRSRLAVVHPSGAPIEGTETVASIAALPFQPDLAIVLTGGDRAFDLIEQLLDLGVRAFNVFANDGRVVWDADRLKFILASAGARLLGPNSPGLVSMPAGAAAHASQFLSRRSVRRGPVAILSHSGAIGGIVANQVLDAQVGFDWLICTGNEINLGLGESLEFLAHQQGLRSIGLFVETIRDVEPFRRGLEAAADRGISVSALKIGWSEAASRAANRHTGAEVASVEVFGAELRRCGAVLCDDLADMTARLAVGSLPRPRGSRLAIAATSGGLTSVLGDMATAAGFDVPDLPGCDNPWDTDFRVVHEPADVGRDWSTMLARPDVDCGILALSAQTDQVMTTLLSSVAATNPTKPFLVMPFAGLCVEAADLLPEVAAMCTQPRPGLLALRAAAPQNGDSQPEEHANGSRAHEAELDVYVELGLERDVSETRRSTLPEISIRLAVSTDPVHGRALTVDRAGGQPQAMLRPPASPAPAAPPVYSAFAEDIMAQSLAGLGEAGRRAAAKTLARVLERLDTSDRTDLLVSPLIIPFDGSPARGVILRRMPGRVPTFLAH